MTKQNIIETRADKKGHSKVKPTVGEPADELTDPAKLLGGPVAGVGDGVVENQATLLCDTRFQTVQRQALAAQIGGEQGNRHMQRVVRSLKQGEKTTNPMPKVNIPAGCYERGADCAVEQVMRTPVIEARIVQCTPDERAAAIIRYAQNAAIAAAERAVNVVRRIIQTYYAAQASLVANVVYASGEPGLQTSCATSPSAQGTISVGDYFLNNTTESGFARRVLQVDHELEHIRQQRAGMGGPQRRHLREFLAFAREAIASEAPGTGTMNPLMRSTLIDEALRHYCQMNDEQQSAQATAQVRLLEARERYQSQIRAGRRTPPPVCSE